MEPIEPRQPRYPLPLAALLTLLVSLAAAPATAADADSTLDMAGRAELIELLERAQAETLRLVMDVDEATWHERPAADRWSIGEVVEHLVLAEGAVRERVTALIEGGPAEFPLPADAVQPTLADLVKLGADRTQRFEAPAAIQPEKPRDKAEVLRDFIEARTDSISFVLETMAPLHAVGAPTPIGQVLDGRGWLGLLGAHNLRHNRQIVEVREQLDLASVD